MRKIPKLKWLQVVLCVLILFSLTACGKTPSAIPEEDVAPANVVPAENTPLPVNTDTPVPTSTFTPLPTNIPEPTITPIPIFARWTSDQVIMAFVDAGLEVGAMRWMSKEDYGSAPMLAKDGTRFFIPSLCADCGGRILAFNDQAGLDATADYYLSLNQSDPAQFSWIFMKSNIIVQLNGNTPETLARKYEAALNGMP